MRRRMIALALLMMFLLANAWAQPAPSTPPSPQSLVLEVPEPTASTSAPPSSETSQMMVSTTAASAQFGAPSTMAIAGPKMIVPPGISVSNKFYIPYSPSTVASTYYGQWVPLWLDVNNPGSLYTYEWYPNGRLVTQYMGGISSSGWRKMWFYGDASGWHTLQYYCMGWSNYIYVYVYPGSSSPKPPSSSCTARITVSSPYSRGFSIYVDGKYVGRDGSNGDPNDGNYAFDVTGNKQHTVLVYHQGGTYQQTKTYHCGNSYTIRLSYAPPSERPPSNSGRPVYPTQPIEPPQVPTLYSNS